MSSLWLEELSREVKSRAESICHIWKEMGIVDPKLEQRKQSLTGHVYFLFDEMRDEEIRLKKLLAESVEQLQVEVHGIEDELGLGKSAVANNQSLIEKESFLSKRKKELDTITECQRKQYTQIRNEEEELSLRLDIPISQHKFNFVPSIHAINAVKLSVEQMSKTKLLRMERLRVLRTDILAARSRLEEEHDTEKLVDILTDSMLSRAPLTQSYLNELSTVRDNYQTRLKELDDKCEQYLHQIEELSSRLKLDTPEYPKPLSWQFSHLADLQEQVRELQELRKRNISVYVETCRVELPEVWDLCHVSDAERASFEPMLADMDFTENLLTRHEKEIERWKSFYEEYKSLFEALEKWTGLCTQLKDNERKLRDPSVLKNRGGILLKVEKEIRRLKQRDVPRAQEVLLRIYQDTDAKLSVPTHQHHAEWNLVRPDDLTILQYIKQLQNKPDADKENKSHPPSTFVTGTRVGQKRQDNMTVCPMSVPLKLRKTSNTSSSALTNRSNFSATLPRRTPVSQAKRRKSVLASTKTPVNTGRRLSKRLLLKTAPAASRRMPDAFKSPLSTPLRRMK